SPGTLRLIVYLRATPRIVGVEDFEKTRPTARPYIMAHPELRKLPIIGPGGPGSTNKEPDVEAVLKVKPDVIFVSYMQPPNADALQTKLGIPVVVLSHGRRFGTFDNLLYDSLRVAGKILGVEVRAEEVIRFIESARNDLHARTRGVPETDKPTVYVGAVGYKGAQGIESTDATFIPLEWVGAKNLAKANAEEGHVFIDKEKLLQWNPDVVFLDGGGLSLVKDDFGKQPQFYYGLTAFRNKRVYVLYPFNHYVTNVSTAIVDAYVVGRILYPDRFSDLAPVAKADEIYSFFYGKPLYEQMATDFGPLGQLPVFLR
ncbi:MAG: iron ABC transporter substrate-binding protein, partial [Deltaproteobacteria bacterium]|nr:iron ABC transporter substrate-binding protein [Deltaproteobacteria bacterium]